MDEKRPEVESCNRVPFYCICSIPAIKSMLVSVIVFGPMISEIKQKMGKTVCLLS
jgi:hypothetical protein